MMAMKAALSTWLSTRLLVARVVLELEAQQSPLATPLGAPMLVLISLAIMRAMMLLPRLQLVAVPRGPASLPSFSAAISVTRQSCLTCSSRGSEMRLAMGSSCQSRRVATLSTLAPIHLWSSLAGRRCSPHWSDFSGGNFAPPTFRMHQFSWYL